MLDFTVQHSLAQQGRCILVLAPRTSVVQVLVPPRTLACSEISPGMGEPRQRGNKDMDWEEQVCQS